MWLALREEIVVEFRRLSGFIDWREKDIVSSRPYRRCRWVPPKKRDTDERERLTREQWLARERVRDRARSASRRETRREYMKGYMRERRAAGLVPKVRYTPEQLARKKEQMRAYRLRRQNNVCTLQGVKR